LAELDYLGLKEEVVGDLIDATIDTYLGRYPDLNTP